jgi:ring-1,2-phenylacetyl-CoA epoxidase subunit PaaB
MADRWEVLGKRTHDDPWTVVGGVIAPDRDLALLLAKESFFRHGEGVDLAVVRASDIHRFAEPDLMTPSTDKSYRMQSAYAGLGEKRRAAHEKIQQSGLVVDRPRPEDKRVRNVEHREREEVS